MFGTHCVLPRLIVNAYLVICQCLNYVLKYNPHTFDFHELCLDNKPVTILAMLDKLYEFFWYDMVYLKNMNLTSEIVNVGKLKLWCLWYDRHLSLN